MSDGPIAVVVAMKREVAPLLRGFRAKQVGQVQVFDMETAVIGVGGIGAESARRTATMLLAEYSPALLVSAGIAGALKSESKVGEVFHAERVVDASTGESFVSTGDHGTVATVSTVSGSDDKRMLAERLHADVVEMEAAAVAKVASASGIDFLAIKAISDELDFVMPPLGRFVSSDGQFHTIRFAAFLAVHPKWWKAAGALGANSRLASMKLSESLQHLIDQQSDDFLVTHTREQRRSI